MGIEYAIADFGAYKIAEKLGKTEDAAYFKKRYKLYEQYFDKEVGHFVGKKANGEFRRPFDPLMAKHRENDYCRKCMAIYLVSTSRCQRSDQSFRW
jgi:putative alpha-1,2-mannosidase